MKPERLIGRLFLVRGDLFDDFHQGGRPLILLPGYINQVVHPTTAKFAAAHPGLSLSVEPTPRNRGGRDRSSGNHRVVQDGNMMFVLTASEYMTPSGPVRLPEYPPERTWHRILVHFALDHKADSIHWAETNSPDQVDVPGNLFRMFVGMINQKKHLSFYYYNPSWPLSVAKVLR